MKVRSEREEIEVIDKTKPDNFFEKRAKRMQTEEKGAHECTDFVKKLN